MDKPSKTDLDRDSFHEVPIIEYDECPIALEVPSTGGDGETKSPGEGTDGETKEEKQDGEKTDDADKDAKCKEKKIWIDFDDFCKSFR